MARSKAGRSAGATTSAEPVHELERARGELLVDRAAGRRQRQEGFSQVGAIGAPGDELALLELRHRARDLGLVHVGLRADRLAGHHAVLAQRDQHPPFGYSNTVAAIDPRERLRHQAGQHVEPVGQEIFELEQRRLGRRGRGGLRRAVTDWTGAHRSTAPRRGAVRMSVATATAAGHWPKISGLCNGDAATCTRARIAQVRGSDHDPGLVERAPAVGLDGWSAQALDGDELVARRRSRWSTARRR